MSWQHVCVYTFDFDNVPAFDIYKLQTPAFTTGISGYALMPYGVVVYVDAP